MLPLTLLKTAVGQAVLVELKNGETYNGVLASCDAFMNMALQRVVCTSRDGESFWQLAACYIRGNTVKYLCIPDDVLAQLPPPEPAQPITQPPQQQPVTSSSRQQQQQHPITQQQQGKRQQQWGRRPRQQQQQQQQQPQSQQQQQQQQTQTQRGGGRGRGRRGGRF